MKNTQLKSKLQNVALYKSSNELDSLTPNQFEILKLQATIDNIYNCQFKQIIDKKSIGKVGTELDSFGKTTLESILSYFINLLLENQKNIQVKQQYIEQKFKYAMLSTSEKNIFGLDIENIKTTGNGNNILDKLNTKLVIEYIKELENNLGNNKLEKINELLIEKEDLKNDYKIQLLLIKENKKNIGNYEKYKKDLLKQYNNKNSQINTKLKRLQTYFKKYEFLLD